MITTAQIAARMPHPTGPLPLVRLAEFFDGNTDEESIAPNQWGYGRPPLEQIAARLRKLEARDDVAWVRVELHPDTELDQEDGLVSAEGIVVCTTADVDSMTEFVSGLESDGAFSSKSKLKDVTDIPHIPADHQVYFIVWD